MKLIALLRAINVGGRVVKMDQLRSIVAAEGFAQVETFIASGNVIFEGRASQAAKAELAIERALARVLGYAVTAFVRSDEEIAAVATHEPFETAHVDRAATFCVAFLKDRPDGGQVRRLMELRSDVHDFHVRGREIFWLSPLKQNDPLFAKVQLDRVLGGPATVRGISTVRKLAAKYPPPSVARQKK
jgi:uncharacterized protein (DUF1697 family)